MSTPVLNSSAFTPLAFIKKSRILALILFSLGLLQGCSLWMAGQYDPDGLPCDPDGRCLAEYTCVENVCRFASALEVGDECAADRECKSNVCADAYGEDCGDNLNCVLGNKEDRNSTGKRCRTACNPSEPASASCATDERCFLDSERSVQGYCQEGTCGVDSVCGENQIPLNNGFDIVQNRCFDTATNPNSDHAGLCILGCNPLLCTAQGGCTGCPLTESACENIENVQEFICVPAGSAAHNAPCGQGTFCQAGSFCLLSDDGATGFCSRYCLVGGGNPQCETGQTCNFLSENVGYCQ